MSWKFEVPHVGIGIAPWHLYVWGNSSLHLVFSVQGVQYVNVLVISKPTLIQRHETIHSKPQYWSVYSVPSWGLKMYEDSSVWIWSDPITWVDRQHWKILYVFPNNFCNEYHHQKLLLTCYKTHIYICVSFIVQHCVKMCSHPKLGCSHLTI